MPPPRGTNGAGTEQERPRHHFCQTFTYDLCPKTRRAADPNMGVNAEVFLYDERFPPKPKTLMMFYKRLREIDVPEMMASIITQTPGKPWGYYRDMTRQLWDEARHAMMGEVGFVKAGVDWRKVMVNFTWSLALNTQLKPIERHAVLYFIEQGLMPKTANASEWEVAQASGDPLFSLSFRVIMTGRMKSCTPASVGTGICADFSDPRQGATPRRRMPGPKSSSAGGNGAIEATHATPQLVAGCLPPMRAGRGHTT
jgi:hypothetical protein